MRKYLLPVLGLASHSVAQAEAVEKPNVIIILTDDQKYNTIGALGNNEVKTPNIDKLVERSMVFRNAYCFGGNSGAVSIPSRNMLMTGRNWFAFEEDLAAIRVEKPKYVRGPHVANGDWMSIPKSFKAAGYDTYYREKDGKANNARIRPHFDHYEDIPMMEQLLTGRAARTIVDDAIQYITQDRPADKPFMMYLGMPCPHDPRWALQEFHDLYDREEISLPPNFQGQYKWNIGSNIIRDEKLEYWPRTEDAIRRHLHDYYALISAMDYDLGRLFATLEQEGMFENTIIIFSSDQGLAMGDHGLLGKQNLYEGTMKVPFFVLGPGIKQGETDAMVYLHDIYPTLCDLIGTDIPKDLDGVSFKQNLTKPKAKGQRDRILLAYKAQGRNQRALRVGDWKLIWYPEIDRLHLFNLKKDPYEINNLAYEAKHTKRTAEMLAMLKEELVREGNTDKLEVDPSINPVFKYPPLKSIKPAGVANGPTIVAPPVKNDKGFPYF